MSKPYLIKEESDKEFIKKFIEYIQDKPFYLKELIGNSRPHVKGDGVSDLFYVGSTNNIDYRPGQDIVVYYFRLNNSGDSKLSTTIYQISDVLNYFKNGTWLLRDWYRNGITYNDVEKEINNIIDFDPFGDINESEEKEWYEDLPKIPFGNDLVNRPWHIDLDGSVEQYVMIQKYLHSLGFKLNDDSEFIEYLKGVKSVQSVFDFCVEMKRFTRSQGRGGADGFGWNYSDSVRAATNDGLGDVLYINLG